MSDERIAKLEKTVQALRRQVDDLTRGQQSTWVTSTQTALACALAGAVAALTATTWRIAVNIPSGNTYVDTLWGMVPEGWPAAVTLALLGVLVVGTVTVFLVDAAGRRTHLAFVAVALVAALGVLLADQGGGPGMTDAENYDTAPGRWLTLAGALALAAVHDRRASDLK